MKKKGQIQDTKPIAGKMMKMRKSIIGGMMKMMKNALSVMMGMKMKKRLVGGNWSLIKNANGKCECTKNPGGQIVVSRFSSRKECEDGRIHC